MWLMNGDEGGNEGGVDQVGQASAGVEWYFR